MVLPEACGEHGGAFQVCIERLLMRTVRLLTKESADELFSPLTVSLGNTHLPMTKENRPCAQ